MYNTFSYSCLLLKSEASAFLLLTENANVLLYQKSEGKSNTFSPLVFHKKYDKNLQNYWRIAHNYSKDLTSGKDLSCKTPIYVKGVFNNNEKDQALRVSNRTSFCAAPPGVYFDGDFSISIWVKFNEIILNQRILDFATNGHLTEDGVLFFMDRNTLKPKILIENNGKSSTLVSTVELRLKQWYFLTFSLNGNEGHLYANDAILATSRFMLKPRGVVRTNNYIGKSHIQDRDVSQADFDEIKIFNRSLSYLEVLEQYYYSNSWALGDQDFYAS